MPSRKQKAINKVADILTKRPKMASQVSTKTLEHVATTTPTASITAKKELQKRATSGDYERPSSRYDNGAVRRKNPKNTKTR